MNAAARQLEALGGRIAALQKSGGGSAAALSNEARASTDLLGALPPRYGEVLLNLLDRLESSALFSEESCSFSQKDLLDNLQVWVDKARAQLSS
ncbi:hypothetical protein GmRootV213_13540 [Variovorax sp. V213]|uniref:hypothetical protein n=1 Tax=Variovorax sp. V213 TaxID=3065955 RepID=UPI0034E88A86